MKKYYLIAAVLLCGACSNDNEPQPLKERERIELTRADEMIVLNSQYEFGRNVFDVLLSNSQNQNFIFSPLSLSVSAAMVANGAAGDTQKEILDVLGYGESDLDQLNSTVSIKNFLPNSLNLITQLASKWQMPYGIPQPSAAHSNRISVLF